MDYQFSPGPLGDCPEIPCRCDNASASDFQKEWLVQWVRNGSPLPDGWQWANEAISHHSRHSRLAVKISFGDELKERDGASIVEPSE